MPTKPKARNLDLEDAPKNMKRLDKLIKDRDVKIEYLFRIEPDDIPVRGNALASGDDEVDKAAEDLILSRLDCGETVAWCVAIVTARISTERHTFQGQATLGCCSYNTEEELRREVFEHYNMKAEALEDLIQALRAHLSIGAEAAEILKAIVPE